MPIEPSFILHASDPAASEALRCYIDKRKKQGATSLEMERLHSLLLEFAAWNRNQSRPPMLQPGPAMKLKPNAKELVATLVEDVNREVAKAKKKK